VNGVVVRASLNGRVDTKTSNLGEYVAEGQEMISVIDPSSTAFIANVPLGELGKIRVGMPARVVLPGLSNVTLSAHVFAIKSHVVAESQTAEVILNFDRVTPMIASALRTDVNGTASFVLSTHASALVVPRSALLRNDETNSYSIMTFGADSIAHPADVERGASRDSLIEIQGSDVHEGMNVVTEGAYALPDSTRITLIH
jgi:membrane fusion protein (multidrug efflux system)